MQTLYLCVGVTELDCDISFEFVLETDSLDARYGFDDCRFTVRYVSDSSCKSMRPTQVSAPKVGNLFAASQDGGSRCLCQQAGYDSVHDCMAILTASPFRASVAN